MSKNIEMKKGVVAGIKEKFEKAQSAVLVDYRGLNVAEVTDLRNQLRKAGVEYAVLKNTMINLAVKDMGYDGIQAHLELVGVSAIAPAELLSRMASLSASPPLELRNISLCEKELIVRSSSDTNPSGSSQIA